MEEFYCFCIFLKKIRGAIVVLLLIFNPLVETLYMIDEEFYKSICTSLKFNFKNFLTWNIPNVVIFAILFNLIMKNYTFEDFIMSNEVVSILKFGLLLMFISLFMLYRANLYRILETGRNKWLIRLTNISVNLWINWFMWIY